MSCDELRPKLSWYLDGELPQAELEAVREHLAACRACAAEVAELRACDEEIGAALEGVRPSRGFAAKVVAASGARRPRWVFRLAAAAAALILCLAGGSSLYVNSLEASPLQVLLHGTERFHADSMGALRVFVRNGQSRLPIASASVRILLAGREVGSWRTGPAGTIDGGFRVPDVADGTWPLAVEVDSPVGKDVIRRSVTVTREVRLLVTTDKPVYQPGQTVRLRALALNAFTLKPRAGDAVFEVHDSKGNRILREPAKLSEFGIGSLELPLADEVNLGTWRVRVDASGVVQERAIEVAKYALPKFKVDLELDRPSYRPGDAVKGTVRAAYFFGKTVRGRVLARVGAETLTGELREDGSWEFQAPAPAAEGLIKVEATVTDTADHRETKATGAHVSRESFRVTLYPEGGQIARGLENAFYLIAAYPDGRPAKAEIALEVNGAALTMTTDELGVARMAVKAPYLIRLDRARDAAGSETRVLRDLRESSSSTDLLVRLDKASYRAGETMSVEVLSTAPGPVYLDVVKGGQLLLTRVLDGAKTEIDLPPDLFGTIQLLAYRDAGAAPAVRVAHVGVPEGLSIRPRAAKEAFRPGEEMPVEFEVVDKDGKPVQAALGISVVDEALFGLVESKIASEKAWLSLAPELLDTRGFLQADPRAIFGGPNADAQRFVSANARARALPRLAETPWAARLAALRERVRSFNERFLTLAKASAVIVVLGLLVALFGAPLLDLLRRVRDSQFSGMLVLFLGVLSIGSLLIGSVLGFHGVVFIFSALLVAFLAHGVYSTGWWFLRGNAAAGLGSLVLGFAALLFAAQFTVGRSVGDSLLPLDAPAAAPEKGAGFEARMREIRRYRSEERLESSPRSEAPGPSIVAGAPRAEAAPVMKETGGAREPARVREWFPETLFWQPQLITDEKGRARLTLPAADSITSWRLMADAIARSGALGSQQARLRVFQDFFVDIDFPVALTKGDRVHVPVAVYNYLPEPQSVAVRVERQPWFELLDGERKTVALKAGEVGVAYFGLRVRESGRKALTVHAEGKTADAIRRTVEVFEKGREVPISVSERIRGRKAFAFEIPANAIEGASVVFARIAPPKGDLLEGLEGMVRLPGG